LERRDFGRYASRSTSNVGPETRLDFPVEQPDDDQRLLGRRRSGDSFVSSGGTVLISIILGTAMVDGVIVSEVVSFMWPD
jgi:hypothetical protein